jgi:serine/threonine-protein kinase RsbW
VTVEAEGAFRGRLASFGEVRALAEAFGAAMGADRGAVLRLVLVLEELFTNTVTHGYPAGGEGPIWIAFAQRADLIEVTYEDAGPPFDPLAEAAARLEDPRTRPQDPRTRPEDPCVGPDDPLARPQDPRARSQDPRVDEGEPLGGIGLAIMRGLSTSARYTRVGDRNRITLTVPAASAPSPDAGA